MLLHKTYKVFKLTNFQIKLSVSLYLNINEKAGLKCVLTAAFSLTPQRNLNFSKVIKLSAATALLIVPSHK